MNGPGAELKSSSSSQHQHQPHHPVVVILDCLTGSSIDDPPGEDWGGSGPPDAGGGLGTAEVDRAIAALPAAHTAAYRRAQERAPQLILTESPPWRFWRCDDFDAAAAARRLICYWETRQQAFGPERAFRPLRYSGGTFNNTNMGSRAEAGAGALELADVEEIKSGGVAILPYSKPGWVALHITDSKRPMQLLRALLYAFAVLVPSYEHQITKRDQETDSSRATQGISMIISLADPDELSGEFARSLTTLLFAAFPMKPTSLSVICSLPPGKQGAFVGNSLTHILESFGAGLMHRVHLDLVGQPREVAEMMVQRGFSLDRLPATLGGSLDYPQFIENFLQMLQQEAECLRYEEQKLPSFLMERSSISSSTTTRIVPECIQSSRSATTGSKDRIKKAAGKRAEPCLEDAEVPTSARARSSAENGQSIHGCDKKRRFELVDDHSVDHPDDESCNQKADQNNFERESMQSARGAASSEYGDRGSYTSRENHPSFQANSIPADLRTRLSAIAMSLPAEISVLGHSNLLSRLVASRNSNAVLQPTPLSSAMQGTALDRYLSLLALQDFVSAPGLSWRPRSSDEETIAPSPASSLFEREGERRLLLEWLRESVESKALESALMQYYQEHGLNPSTKAILAEDNPISLNDLSGLASLHRSAATESWPPASIQHPQVSVIQDAVEAALMRETTLGRFFGGRLLALRQGKEAAAAILRQHGSDMSRTISSTTLEGSVFSDRLNPAEAPYSSSSSLSSFANEVPFDIGAADATGRMNEALLSLLLRQQVNTDRHSK